MARTRETEAIVWRRSDFRETSRVVTLVTREGKVTALAKGAHRPTSGVLGRIDYLNRVTAHLSGGDSSMPVLSRAVLLHEPRGLRDPRRFAVAQVLVEELDRALLEGRADAGLYELLRSALTLVERCPMRALPNVWAGVEWRLLAELGVQPGLDRCSATGSPLPAGQDAAVDVDGHGLSSLAQPSRGRRIAGETLAWLRHLADTPARRWHTLPRGPALLALDALGVWLAAGLDRPSRWRRAARAQLATWT
jgi:DNA repair protein RecO